MQQGISSPSHVGLRLCNPISLGEITLDFCIQEEGSGLLRQDQTLHSALLKVCANHSGDLSPWLYSLLTVPQKTCLGLCGFPYPWLLLQ